MKEWHIFSKNKKQSILVNQLSFFKQHNDEWQFLIDDLSTFFSKSAASNSVKIIENNQSINKHDFQFFYLNLDDIDSDNHLYAKEHKKQFFNQLEFSPFYHNLVDAWTELIEEVEFLNDAKGSIYLKLNLADFKSSLVYDSLQLDMTKLSSLSKVDRALFKIEMVAKFHLQKQLLIAIHIPNYYFSEREYHMFTKGLTLLNSGVKYFIFSEHCKEEQRNLISHGKMYNRLQALEIEPTLNRVIPINWNHAFFEKAVNLYVFLVDNFQDKTPFLSLSSVDNLESFIYVYSIFILSRTTVIVDTTGIRSSIQKYFDNLLMGKV